MQSPYSFLVKPVNDRRYDNVSKMGDVDFLISTSEEDHVASNRFAEVLNVPIGYTGEVKIGDTMLVHHNVFKFYNDMKGRRKSGKSFFKEDLFFVDNDQFYLYKQDGKWHSHDRFCFVKPVDTLDSFIDKACKYEPLMGDVVYPNEYLKSQGINKGDRIYFTPDSEYEFTVDGETLYRVFDHQVTMKA